MNMTDSGGLAWTNMPPMPGIKILHQMVVADRKVLAIGGTSSTDLFVFHIDNSTWQTVDLPMATLHKYERAHLANSSPGQFIKV